MERTRHLPFRPDLEGLRGVAILLVVAYHAGVPGFTGGYVGVDVFFVLSGYLITSLLVQEIETTGRLDFIAFYARRARRLLPALAVVVLATIALGYFVYSPAEQHEIARSAFATEAYVGNLYFAWIRSDYLHAEAEANPLLHTWSLSVEEQFYLFWPIFICGVLWAGSRLRGHGFRRQFLLVSISAVGLLSLLLSLRLMHAQQPWAFYSSPTRAWEFAVGGLAALVPSSLGRPILSRLAWCGVAMLGYATFGFSDRTLFPGIAALVPVIGTGVILVAGANGFGSIPNRYLGTKFLRKLGDVSYSWYLWHWPILTMALAWAGRLSLPSRLGWLLVSLGIAFASHQIVENPLRYNRVLARRPLYSMTMAAGLTIFCLGTAIAWRSVTIHALAAPAQMRIAKAREDAPVFPKGCMADYSETSINACTFGSKLSGETIVLFGDSHAAQWVPPLDAIASADGWRLVTLMKSACSPADISFVYPALGRRYFECEKWREAALEHIEQMRPKVVIVTSSQWYARTSEPLAPVTASQYLSGMQRTFAALDASGARVVYLWDTPRLESSVPDCLARSAWQQRFRGQSVCDSRRESVLDENAHRLDLAAASGHSVFPVDLTRYICPQDECAPEVGNLIVYRDSNHITASFAMTLSPVLESQIAQAIGAYASNQVNRISPGSQQVKFSSETGR